MLSWSPWRGIIVKLPLAMIAGVYGPTGKVVVMESYCMLEIEFCPAAQSHFCQRFSTRCSFSTIFNLASEKPSDCATHSGQMV